MIRKPNNNYPYFLVIIILLIVFFMGGCSVGEGNSEQDGLEEKAMLPSLEQVLPNDQYLFLPLENVGFRLIFTGAVDPSVDEQAISFEPELDFAVRSEGYGPGEIYLDPQEKLQPDTSYILRIKDVHNTSTGKPETLRFAYRTEFRGDWRIAKPRWSEGTGLLLYGVQQKFLGSFGLNSGYQKHPAVSPAGEHIAFTANKDGNWNLYLREKDTIKQLTSHPGHELYPSWSPNGEKLAFVSTQSGSEELWLLELSRQRETINWAGAVALILSDGKEYYGKAD